jgi:hypothetical protein
MGQVWSLPFLSLVSHPPAPPCLQLSVGSMTVSITISLCKSNLFLFHKDFPGAMHHSAL